LIKGRREGDGAKTRVARGDLAARRLNGDKNGYEKKSSITGQGAGNGSGESGGETGRTRKGEKRLRLEIAGYRENFTLSNRTRALLGKRSSERKS